MGGAVNARLVDGIRRPVIRVDVRALLSGEFLPEGRWKRYSGPAGGGLRTVVVDASPIGRTPPSVPASMRSLNQPR